MASQNDELVAQDWFNKVGTDKRRISRKSANIVAYDSQLCSYGSHFVLCELIGDRENGILLINGDRSTQTTSSHQAVVRGLASRSPWPSIIVPFTALDAA